MVSEDLMIVPVHVADTRSFITPDDWQHRSYIETEDGDVELHIYRRDADN